MIKINFFNGLVAFIVLYGAFQYGRVVDDHQIVDQPEYNHFVYSERCEVVTDSIGTVECIWFNNRPYTLDLELIENL